MKLSTPWRVGLVALLVLLAVAAFAFLRFGRSAAVPMVAAQTGRVVQRVVGPGTVQARVPVTIAARITATVRQVDVDVGDLVKQGQQLALLDDRDLAARRGVVDGQQSALARNLDAARATLARTHAEHDLARSKQQRDAELLRTGFVSQAVLDASDAALRGAAANVDNARATLAAREADARTLQQEARYAEAVLSYTRIVAPIDGMVIARQAEPGSTVVPGSTLLRIVDPTTLWVATRVDESVLGRVQLGQAASIRLRTGETLAGKVARIARQSDAATRELEVHVAFDAVPQRFAIDQEAEVAIDTGSVEGLVVPVEALTRSPDGRQGVLVVDGGRTAFRPLRTGASDGRHVVVAEGLAAGETIVAQAAGVGAGRRVRAQDAPRP